MDASRQGSTYSYVVTSNLSGSLPQFPVSDGITYTFYRITDGAETVVQTGPSATCEDTVEVSGKNVSFPVRSYRVEVTVHS